MTDWKLPMRFKQLAAFGLACALPLAVLADPPGKGRGGDRNGGGQAGPGGHNNRPESADRGGAPGMKPFNELTEEEKKQHFKELAEFCEKYSPNRWQDITRKNDKGDRQFAAIGQMAMRLRFLKSLEKEDPKLFAIKRDQIKVEDEEYGLIRARAYPDDPEKNPEKLTADAIGQKLRETATKYVALRLEERKLRIAKLDQMIKKEMEDVKADLDNSEDLAQKHFDKINAMTPEQMLAPSRGGGGRGGPREGGNGPGGPGGPGGGPPGGGPGFNPPPDEK